MSESSRAVGKKLLVNNEQDTSVYSAAVGMSQDFNKRYPLIDAQGNMGSLDGDSPAAMRYTEMRLSAFGEAMVTSTNKNVVPFTANYDETLEEPESLATLFPSIILNGNEGIAVGLASSMLPHYAKDVYKAIDVILDNSLNGTETSDDDVINIIKAPDFPLGGIIINPSEIVEAYKTGRGTVKVRAHHEIEDLGNGKQQLVFTDIPYNVNKAVLVSKMYEYVVSESSLSKAGSDVIDIRDESDKNGIRIVVELRKGANADVVLANLFKKTKLQSNIQINNVVLDEKGMPIENVSLLNLLNMFIGYVCVFKLKEYQLLYTKYVNRCNIVEGIIKAKLNIKDIISIIEKADDNVVKALMDSSYQFNELQAKAIADMKLSQLNKTNTDKYVEEMNTLTAKVNDLKRTLSSKDLFLRKIKKEFKDFSESKIFSNDIRRTEISYAYDANIDERELINEEDIIVTYSHDGLLKVVSTNDYNAQDKNGKGRALKIRDNDFIEKILSMTTKDDLFIITNLGRCHVLPIYKVPIVSKASQGKYIYNYIELEENEKIMSIVSGSTEDMDKDILLLTANGLIKRFRLTNLSKRSKTTRIITLKENDSIADCCLIDDDSKVVIIASNGKAVKFNVDKIRPSGRLAMGVKGIKIKDDDKAIKVLEANESNNMMIAITANGKAKRLDISSIHDRGRGTMGMAIYKSNTNTGELVSATTVNDDDTVFIVTKNGMVIRIPAESIKEYSRNAKGSRAINLNDGDSVLSIIAAPSDDNDDLEETESIEDQEVVA